MNYSKAIRIARSLADMPQRELAQHISLDPSLISMLESGKRNPSRATLEKIAKRLGIPLHLFTLLAAEPEDLKGVSAEEISSLATGLIRLLLEGKPDDSDANAGLSNTEAGHRQLQRLGSSSRSKARKTA
jgi:transcriptional regulator with XRE-family HTH domain